MNQEQDLAKKDILTTTNSTSWSTNNSPSFEQKPKNIYPYLRHLLLITLVLLAFFTLIFLIHQNGKSLYEHGI
jgi:hypothetical protein